MFSRANLLAVFTMLAVGAGIAEAGAIFRTTVENFMEDNQFFDAQESYQTVTKIDGNRMKMDTQSLEGQIKQTVIFLGETDEMYMVDHEKKTYLVMDKEQIEALGSQISDAMKQMQEALAQVPPEQREMMERMMKDRMGGGGGGDVKPPSPPVVTDLGESGNVNGVSCQWKQVTRDGKLEEKACVARETDIAGGDEMVALAHEMRDFAEGMMRAAQAAADMPMFGGGTMTTFAAGVTADLGGYPVISENYDGNGELMSRSTFESADQVSVPEGEFTPPSDYKRQSLDSMMR